VEVVNDITKKLKLSSLPVQTAVTTALATKENTITSGTTAQYFRGDKSFQTLDKTAVGLANVDNTSDANKPVSSAQQTALNAKQDTLVSGTNIKTLNSTSLLGSGNIVLTANPSGVSGAIQFSNGSAFASDAANLFWDDTNNRLGVGTNAPTASIQATTFKSSSINDSGTTLQLFPSYNTYTFAKFTIGAGDLAAQLGIKGSGSTSATTSLLVQNSAGTTALQVQDNLSSTFGGNLIVNSGSFIGISNGSRSIIFDSTGATNLYTAFGGHRFSVWNTSAYVDLVTITGNSSTPSLLVGTTTANNSAIVNISSTTQGFLPPRGTNTQMNAIASPATGLVFYDTTNNKLCVFNATSWIPLH
jgi:hypothetical protein